MMALRTMKLLSRSFANMSQVFDNVSRNLRDPDNHVISNIEYVHVLLLGERSEPYTQSSRQLFLSVYSLAQNKPRQLMT